MNGVCETPGQTKSEVEMLNNNSEDKLIYVGDPMCSWCWGITNHLEKLKTDYKDQFDFQLVLGGLRPGGGEEWNEHFREMIKGHWHHVEDASGQPFDYTFFDRESFNYDTEPAARSVRVVRDIAPNKEWEFYKSLQRSFYAENKDLNDLNLLEVLCKQLEVDYEGFESVFLSVEYKKLVKEDFIFAQQLGVRGFPAVVMKKGEEYIAITLGYSDYDTMKSRMEMAIAG